MGQKLYTDRIGALSFSSPNVILQPSILTIGGQQYVTTSALNVSPTGLSAASLYMIYAVQTAGVVSLVLSTNVNSVGPSGYSSWKLVGAFYSNDTPAFGAFVNIEGPPECGAVGFTPTFNGLSGPSGIAFFWNRVGKHMYLYGRVNNVGTSQASTFYMSTPTGPSVDLTELPASTSINCGRWERSAANGDSRPMLFDSPTPTRLYFTSANNGAFNGLNANGLIISGEAMTVYNVRLPISGWDNRPLKDL